MNTIDRKAYMPTLNKLTAQVAKLLKGRVTKRATVDCEWYAEITVDGLPIGFNVDAFHGRLKISIGNVTYMNQHGGKSTVTLRDAAGHEEWNAATTEIGVALTRDAAAIARDIERRLIPTSKPLYLKALDYANKHQQHADEVATTRRALAKHFRVEMRDHSPDKLYLDGLTLEVSSADSVRLNDVYCTPETAKKIVALLKADRK